jgi:hypothetical protein
MSYAPKLPKGRLSVGTTVGATYQELDGPICSPGLSMSAEKEPVRAAP